MASRLGELEVSLSANISRFTKALDEAESRTKKRMDGIRRGVKRAATSFAALASGAAFTAIVKNSLNAADALAKLSAQTGFTVEQIQKYEFAAGQSGVATANFQTGIQAFAKRLGELKAGTGGLLTFLKKYDEGLIASLQSTTSTDEAFRILAQRFGEINDAGTRAAFGAAAFSRSAGVEMAALLAQGQGALDEFGTTLEKTGSIIDTKAAQSAERANDALDLLNRSTLKLANVFAVELAEPIATVAQWLAEKLPNAFAESRMAVSDFIEIVIKTFDEARQALSDFIEAVAEFPSKVAGAFKDTVSGIKENVTELTGSIFDRVKGFFTGVTDEAEEMHDKVVGRSFVPDMVRGIASWFGKLDEVMVEPAFEATESVTGAFEGMARSISDIISDVLLGVRSFGDALKQFGRQILNDLVRGGIGKIVDIITGGGGKSGGGSGLVSAIGGSLIGKGIGKLFGGLFGGGGGGRVLAAVEDAALGGAAGGAGFGAVMTKLGVGLKAFGAKIGSLATAVSGAIPPIALALGGVLLAKKLFGGGRSKGEIFRDEMKQVQSDLASGASKAFQLGDFKVVGGGLSSVFAEDPSNRLADIAKSAGLNAFSEGGITRITGLKQGAVELEQIIADAVQRGLDKGFSLESVNTEIGELTGVFDNASRDWVALFERGAQEVGGSFEVVGNQSGELTARLKGDIEAWTQFLARETGFSSQQAREALRRLIQEGAVGFDVLRGSIGSVAGELGIAAGAALDLSNRIRSIPPVPGIPSAPPPQNLGGFANGGTFTVPGTGNRDRGYLIGLTPGEVFTVRDKGSQSTLEAMSADIRGLRRDLRRLQLERGGLRGGR